MNSKVFTLSQGMVKAFLIKGDNGSILVDTGMPGKREGIVNSLMKNGVGLKDISLIIATHNHTDHVGELKNLKELTGAKVAIHESEAENLRLGKTEEIIPTGFFGKLLTRFLGSSDFEGTTADILINDDFSLEPFGVEGKVIHTPGHTQGSVTIILSNGEAIVGDLVSGKSKKGESHAGYPIFAANLQELGMSLWKILEYSPKVIHNSHGVPCTEAALREMAEKLRRSDR